MTSQLNFFPDAEVREKPTPKPAVVVLDDDEIYGDTNPHETPGLFPGVIISEGDAISLDDIEQRRRAIRRKHERHGMRPKVGEEQREIERRQFAERAALERQQTAESRRAAMSRRGARS